MKTVALLLISLAFLPLSCSRLKESQKQLGPGSSNTWRDVRLAGVSDVLFAAQKEDGSYEVYSTIGDSEFARALLVDLIRQPYSKARVYTFVAPSLVVFRRSDQDAVSAFLYWPAGKPMHVFAPCEIREIGGNCFLISETNLADGRIVLPDFHKRMAPYFDVWGTSGK